MLLKLPLRVQDEVGGGRLGSVAVMSRPVMDYSSGRSFTASSSPAVRKYANAPIVNKIEEHMQVRMHVFACVHVRVNPARLCVCLF